MSPSTTRAKEFGPVTRTDIVRYAGASNDFNPMHHDDEFARAAGMPSVFAHGMLSAGLLASHVETWAGEGAVVDYRVRFAEQVWPGDRLVPHVEVVRREGRRAHLAVTLERDGGGVAVTGSAVVDLDEEDEA